MAWSSSGATPPIEASRRTTPVPTSVGPRSTYGSVQRAFKENCDADALITRGVGKEANGDLDGAIADLTEAIQLKPDNAMAYRSRGLAKRAKNNVDGANADFAKAMELDAAGK